MAQFGGQKNPPWTTQFSAAVTQPGALGVQPSLLGASPAMYTQQTALAAAGLTTQTATGYQLTQTAALQQQAAAAAVALQQQYQQPQQTIYSVQQQLQQPQQALLSQPAVALPTSLNAPQTTAQITVSYPTPRSAQKQNQPQKQRVFTGVVTKLHDTFGFVDEDVFFQLSAVKGKAPQVGDRVLVEAAYNPNMPFKWNAQRIQTLPNQSQTQPLIKTPPTVMQSLTQQPYGVPPQAQAQSLLQASMAAAPLTPLLGAQPQPLLQQPQQKPGLLQPPVRVMPQPQPMRRVEPPSRFIARHERLEISLTRKDERRDRDRRRSRDRSPQRKRSRERSPRRERDRSPRRQRRTASRYTVQFSKFSLDCTSCDMMELRRRYQNLYIPSDFFDTQFTWVDAFLLNRPFQLGNQCNFHIMHKEVDPLEKITAVLDPPDADHMYSAKVMLLASPGMEELFHKSCALAEDSQEVREGFQHPARLIKFLVGMKGKDEAMAIGGHWSPSLDGPNPDTDPSVLIRTAIRCCKALTSIDLSGCTQWYRFAEIRYHRPEEHHKGRTVPAHVETVVIFLPDVWHCLPTRSEWEALSRGYKQQLAEKLQAEHKEADGEQEEEEKDDGESKEISTPTHWSKLDPKTMKEDEKKRQEEAERQRRERRYVLPDESSIIVHPNWTAKGGKFDCSVMSLSVLLDYRLEDNKEHSFEVSLFAELFNEMLQRDFGYRIYKALVALPEKDDKKEKEKKERKEEKKESEKKEKKEEKDEETNEPKSKRRKSGDEKDKKEDKDGNKKEEKDRDEKDFRKRNDSKEDEEMEEDANLDDYDPLDADDAEDEDEDDRDDEDSRDQKDDRREGSRRSRDPTSKDKEKKQMFTFNKDLLLAFVYFDQSYCGYLLEKDLEEIIYTLGLHLSRAQVKKLINKVVLRETCSYRKLTDGSKDEVKVPVTESEVESDHLLGNKLLLPNLIVKPEANEKTENNNLIVYNGTMVDVGNLLQKLQKSEKARAEMELKAQTLEAKIEEGKKQISNMETASRSLSSEMKENKKYLARAEENLKVYEEAKLRFEQQLINTNKKLSSVMEEIHSVLKKGEISDEDKSKKSKENGAPA
ncbi:cell division cycle and apoptosis regulator protein 1 isoform X2 [Mobula hypostoma]|uniref:cell division cycle and apoptosis regulator protein 1 isoform X2 n=1 Tax=Mobula hypostoma TaxID=723540 RepID=UPI002FC3A475